MEQNGWIEIEVTNTEDVEVEIPPGKRIINRVIVSESIANKSTAYGESMESAQRKARSSVPEGAEIYDEKIIPASVRTLDIEAHSESEAMSSIQRDKLPAGVKINKIRLDKVGRKGILGFGRIPNHYSVEYNTLAKAIIKYRSKGKVKLWLQDIPINATQLVSEISKIKNELIKTTTSVLADSDLKSMNAVVALQVLSGLFGWLNQNIANPLRILVEDACRQMPHKKEIMDFSLPTVGPPEKFSPEDFPVFWDQCTEMLKAINNLLEITSSEEHEGGIKEEGGAG